MPWPAATSTGIAVLSILVLSGCVADPVDAERAAPAPAMRSVVTERPVQPTSGPTTSAAEPTRQPTQQQMQPKPQPQPTQQPRMLSASMRIPAIGLGAVAVVPYRGSPDDGPGTRIQDGGVSASPFGRHGGIGPGQVGNYIVTAHRTSAGAPFADLPSMRRGEHVLIRAAGQVFEYRIVATRSTSFRSPRSLARQSAAVPGHPGRQATRPMITLSTCATQEDHARGNYWADEHGNPEHRIDKIGVLVGVRRA